MLGIVKNAKILYDETHKIEKPKVFVFDLY